jgi:hypothetical protein
MPISASMSDAGKRKTRDSVPGAFERSGLRSQAACLRSAVRSANARL